MTHFSEKALRIWDVIFIRRVIARYMQFDINLRHGSSLGRAKEPDISIRAKSVAVSPGDENRTAARSRRRTARETGRDDCTRDLAYATASHVSNEPGIAQHTVVKKSPVHRISVRGPRTLTPVRATLADHAIYHTNRSLSRESSRARVHICTCTRVSNYLSSICHRLARYQNFETLRQSDEKFGNAATSTSNCGIGVYARS